MEAHNASESLPRFPASLYRGTVALGSALGTVVQDAAEPSLPLRVWAQDPEFPVGTAGPWVCLASLRGWVGGYEGSLGPGLTETVSRTSTQPSRIESPTTRTFG